MQRILIVDDDAVTREVTSQILKNHGYSVEATSSGSQALDAYRKNPSHLIITDVLMPNQGGLEFISELHKEFPQAKLIAMSGGFKGNDTPNIAKVLGVKHTLAKPFEPEQLLKVVGDAIQ